MTNALKNLFLGTLIFLGLSAQAQDLSLIESCVSSLRMMGAAEACAGIKNTHELRAVLSCANSIGSGGERAAACKGVKNQVQAEVVVECVETLGIYPGRACTGVQERGEIQMVDSCVRQFGNGKSALACQLR